MSSWAISACSATIVSNCTNQAVTVNAEPRGSVELGWLPTADARIGRFFRMGSNRLEVSLDIYNVFDKGTVTGASFSYTTWLAPSSVIPPRLLKVSLTFDF